MTLGETLRFWRERKKMTRKGVLAQFKYSMEYLRQLEKDMARPSVEAMDALVAILEPSAEEEAQAWTLIAKGVLGPLNERVELAPTRLEDRVVTMMCAWTSKFIDINEEIEAEIREEVRAGLGK